MKLLRSGFRLTVCSKRSVLIGVMRLRSLIELVLNCLIPASVLVVSANDLAGTAPSAASNLAFSLTLTQQQDETAEESTSPRDLDTSSRDPSPPLDIDSPAEVNEPPTSDSTSPQESRSRSRNRTGSNRQPEQPSTSPRSSPRSSQRSVNRDNFKRNNSSTRSLRKDTPNRLNNFEKAKFTEQADTSSSLGEFKVISDRNIFNSQRSPRLARGRPDTEKPTRAETITLVGILVYDKGPYAFFDGTSKDFKRAVETNGEIATYRVTTITENEVKLVSGTNEVFLRVGGQLKREDDGEWLIQSRGGIQPAASFSSSGSTDPASSNEGDDEVVKRMMQQREQELK